MSELTINCPHCDQQILGDTDYAGQTLSCPGCSGEFVMPGDPAPAARSQPTVTPKAPSGPPKLKVRGGHSHRTAADFHPDEKHGPSAGDSPRGPRRRRQEEEVDEGRPAEIGIAGFRTLLADPVTGQREACDEMGPGVVLGMALLFLALIPAMLLVVGRIELGSFPPGKELFIAILSIVVFILLQTFFVWVLKMMSSQEGTFSEVLLVTGLGIFLLMLFVILGQYLAKYLLEQSFLGGFSALNISFLLAVVYTPLFLGACSFITITYGAFRNLCGTPGSSAFWLTPFTMAITLLAFVGYIRILAKIMS